MKLPNKVDIINEEWQKAYDHFRHRLNERYQIDISFKDYILLTKEPLGFQVHQSENISHGFVKIDGKEVLVVKNWRDRRLSTALPLRNRKKS